MPNDHDPLHDNADTTALGEIRWRKPQTEGDRVSARGGHSTSLVNTDLVFFGGHCYSGQSKFSYYNDTQALDLETNTWHKVDTAGEAPGARYAHSASTIGSKIYIFGGRGEKGKCFNDIYFLETQTWTWHKVASSTEGPCARFGHAQCVIGNKIVMFGGWNGRKCFNDLWIFDVEHTTWRCPVVEGSKPIARYGHTLNLTIDGRLVVFGGTSIDDKLHPHPLQDLRWLDISTMEWSRPRTSGIWPKPRSGHRACVMGKYLLSIGGHLFNPMGSKPSGNDQANGLTVHRPLMAERMLCLDTQTLTWEKVGNVGCVPDNTYGHSINIAGDHMIIFGGWSNRAQNELYVGKVSGAIAASVERTTKLASGEGHESEGEGKEEPGR